MKKKYIRSNANLLIGLLSLHTFFSCVNTKWTLGLSVEMRQIKLLLSSTLLLLSGSQPIHYYPWGQLVPQWHQSFSYNSRMHVGPVADLEKLGHLKKVSKLKFNQAFKLNPIRVGSDTIIDPPCVQSNQICADAPIP